MNLVITSNRFSSPVLKSAHNLNIPIDYFTEAELEQVTLSVTSADKIYLESSENSLGILRSKDVDPQILQVMSQLQAKVKVRELISQLYPEYYFTQTSLSKLEAHGLPREGRYILKPNRGFFAMAVREVNGQAELPRVCSEIRDELNHASQFFSESTLSNGDDLILEEYIEGEEYAIDMYYSEHGEPVIINIFHHPIPEKKEYLHTLYYSSAAVFEKVLEPALVFFRRLNVALGAKNIPIHAEVRLHQGKLVPIELNGLRFGGYGLSDLVQYAYGFNPYTAFFSEQIPDWKSIWLRHAESHYAFVLGYNGSGIDTRKSRPDETQFKSLFSNVLAYYPFDATANPMFAIAFVETKNYWELEKLLHLEFRDFFKGGDALGSGKDLK